MTDEARTILDAAAEHLPKAEILSDDAYPRIRGLVHSPNQRITFEDMERFGDAPARIRQTTTFETPQALISYVGAFGVPASTRIFASLADRKVTALIDYHGASDHAPSWVTHKAVYPAAFAPAFAAWATVHGKDIPQRAFAAFLEDRAEDAVSPDPATLMEVASKFEAIRNVDFRSVVNVATNERQFRYEEKDSVGGGVSAPKAIKLFTPVFQGCDPVEWSVRFAYDIADGKLTFKVSIHRFDELLDAQFERLLDAIAVGCPSIPVHRGKAVS